MSSYRTLGNEQGMSVSKNTYIAKKGKSIIMQNTLWYSAFLIVLLVQIISGMCIFVLLFFINAPYGRHISKKFGRTMNPHLDWILMELPAFSLVIYIYSLCTGAINDSRSPIAMLIFFVLWEIHYFHRPCLWHEF